MGVEGRGEIRYLELGFKSKSNESHKDPRFH